MAVSFAIIAVLAFAAAYVSGYEPYRYQNRMTVSMANSSITGWRTLNFYGASGTLLAEMNFSATEPSASNSSNLDGGFVFLIWHAKGFTIARLNLTFDLTSWPDRVWFNQLNYYADGHPPLNVENYNFSGGPTGASGCVLTLSEFPTKVNPTVMYGIGLRYGYLGAPHHIQSTSVLVRLVLNSGSIIPLVGEAYVGELGFNLV